MDFMKVLDQTVREIKREVNLKVLKVPEVEQKVLDATDNEPWGPHGTALAEIARATKKFTECQMVMNVLWTRLSETGKDWRHVYKALAVIEYLVAHGSERAIDDIVEHTFQISSLASFEFVEPNGKDMGINVRKKVENIVALLNDKDKIQEVRNKAEANRDKYFGLSSSGITYKSASASHGSSSYGSNQYSGFSGSRESYTLRDDYEERNRFNGGKFDKGTTKSHLGVAGENQWHTSKKAHTRHDSKDEDVSSSSMPSKKGNDFNKRGAVLSDGSSVPSSKYEDDFDDFDPRGTSTADPVAGRSNQVDLFADNLVSGLIDAPASVPTEGTNNSVEDDLFADATFVSRAADVGARASSLSPPHVNLFASQPPAPSPSSPIVDLFHTPDPVAQTETKTSKLEHINTNTVDPFASVPLNSYGSGLFGAFTSNTEVCIDPTKDDSLNSSGEKTSVEFKSVPKKNDFKVKSGIWADSLSRGLIDLNISAPAKKVNLADMGIIGGDQRQKGGPLSSSSIGRTTSVGSGLGKTAAGGGGDIFSSLGGEQYQFGSFKK